MSTVAVFDVGKTTLKLMAVTPDGRLLETLSASNPVLPGPPYRHHDLAALEDWLLDGLAALGRRYDIEAIVTCGHGSGGMLVDDDRALMPMIDYEQAPPATVDAEYRRIVGSFRERGSAIMLGTAHMARQMLWLEHEWPEAFARARAYLANPQYWAWRLSGVMASEVTSLAAQSHLWCPADRRPAKLLADKGWARLVPPFRPAWATLGPLKPELAARAGLPSATRVLSGIHDSSANLYRYQAAGLADMTVVSTGTWIVAISDREGPDFDIEQPGLCCNADVHGNPLPGMLSMGGREFSAVAGDARGPASPDRLARLIASDTMALPAFSGDDGLFPGSARQGVIEGPLAEEPASRFTLAVLYAALLTDRCLDAVETSTVVLDGSFVRDPLFGAIVAALRPHRRVVVNLDQYGTVTGAALLATHETRRAPAAITLETPPTLAMPELPAYRERWRARANSRRLK